MTRTHAVDRRQIVRTVDEQVHRPSHPAGRPDPTRSDYLALHANGAGRSVTLSATNDDHAVQDVDLHLTCKGSGVTILPRIAAANLPAAQAGRLAYDATNSKLTAGNGSTWEQVASDIKKRVFDVRGENNKPTAKELGLMPARIVYESSLWPQGESKAQPHEATVRALAPNLPTNRPVVLNVEQWSMDDDVIEQTVDKLIQIVDWIKAENPDVKLGYYLLLPKRDYWASVDDPESAYHNNWRAATTHPDRLRLADAVDYIFPSLYTFYDDQSGWTTYATKHIIEAEKYGKPVFPFLWELYHSSNQTLGLTYVGDSYWLHQLQTVDANANGITIWGGVGDEWDGDAAWWIVTEGFLSS